MYIYLNMEDIRTCSKCYKKLELQYFSVNYKGEPCKGCKTCNKRRNDFNKLPQYQERMKRYNQENKEHQKEIHNQWRHGNKERLNVMRRQYCQDNKEHINELHRQYYQTNKEHINELQRQWRQDNSDKLNVKVVCGICGSETLRRYRSKHEKTIKCQTALNNKLNTPLCEFYLI